MVPNNSSFWHKLFGSKLNCYVLLYGIQKKVHRKTSKENTSTEKWSTWNSKKQKKGKHIHHHKMCMSNVPDIKCCGLMADPNLNMVHTELIG
jgi:hypothetical protein